MQRLVSNCMEEVSGSADSAVQALIEGNLSYNPDVMCDHHGEDHHGDHENCGWTRRRSRFLRRTLRTLDTLRSIRTLQEGVFH